jgi:excisionase family DNA binding protein
MDRERRNPLASDRRRPPDWLVDLASLRASVEAMRAELRSLSLSSRPTVETAMSVDETARSLGCRRRQVFRLLRAGELRRAPKVGRRLMVLTDSVNALLRQGAPRSDNTRVNSSRSRKAGSVRRAWRPLTLDDVKVR